jgi:hypothetical protein
MADALILLGSVTLPLERRSFLFPIERSGPYNQWIAQ